ncbi:MAG: lactonase family protein [Flavobacteriaceae bacterium]|nr:lactonase family protein [Flavobacteriaceae bacterium]
MKQITLLLLVVILVSCQTKKENTFSSEEAYPFYVGTYTKGDSQGIYKYTLQKDGIIKKVGLAAKSNNPSFLTWSYDKKFLLAVNEINSEDGNGTVESFLMDNDSLIRINKSSSGGAHPCFVATNKSGFVLTANYSSGNIGLLRLNNEGELSNLLDVQQHTGKGIDDRQNSPHAHSAWFDFDDDNIISIDLGSNELWFSQLDTLQQKLIASTPAKMPMSPGAGPRHLTFHPNKKWVYVVNELDCTISLLQKNTAGKYEKNNTVSTLPLDYKEPNTCADIHTSSDGKFVYASNRGHNSIAIFEVNNLDGSLKLIGHESTKGDSPRNFSLSPNGDFLLVANQLTNNIVSLKRDKNTGLLEFVHQIEAPTPVCVLFN